MNMKRAIILAVALIAAISSVFTGTTAFFTDSVSANAVIAVGNIDVEQIEMMRGSEGLTKYDNRALYPAVYDSLDYAENAYTGSFITENKNTCNYSFKIWDDAKVAGVYDKMVFVENVGSNPFYFRTVFAFEADEAGEIEHIEMNRDTDKYIWKDDIGTAEINGKTYVLVSATYKEKLESKTVSAPSLIQVAMDKAAQNDYVEYFGEKYEILVVTQAIQTTVEGMEGYAEKTEAELPAFAIEKGFGAVTADVFKNIKVSGSALQLTMLEETEETGETEESAETTETAETEENNETVVTE